MEEYEVKFLNIDVVAIEKKLTELGATKVFDVLYKRKVFDHPDLRLNSEGAYLRLRDEGDKIILTFKKRLGIKKGENDSGMEEIAVEVKGFEKTATILTKIGLIVKFYEENRRVRWQLGDIEFDIDTWPLLNPYLEIEAPSWEKVGEAIKLLGLNPADKKIFTTFQIYEQNGINELDFDILTLDKQVKKSSSR